MWQLLRYICLYPPLSILLTCLFKCELKIRIMFLVEYLSPWIDVWRIVRFFHSYCSLTSAPKGGWETLIEVIRQSEHCWRSTFQKIGILHLKTSASPPIFLLSWGELKLFEARVLNKYGAHLKAVKLDFVNKWFLGAVAVETSSTLDLPWLFSSAHFEHKISSKQCMTSRK